uniref:Uncharacterized protein n=1 Tax=Chenopodium quinoa TaxID=63459 RepID=A0A803MYB4_CHEQI
MTRMEELGLKEQAKSLMAQVQNNRGNQSKNKKKKVSGDDELYRANQDMEHELDSIDEELPIPQSKSKGKSNAIQWKIRKMKALTRKAVMAKRRRNVDLASSHAEKDKPRRGPTMCYKVHGRTVERLEITLNEHGQPVGPDDSTCNEFISFLGTIARKANILPLTVKNWPILRNEKKEELWDYVLERCMQNKANRLVGKEKNIMHTSGPKSFARVRFKWKKDNKTTKNPSLAQMFIATRKEKLTKRKLGDLRDKLMTELEKLDSEEEEAEEKHAQEVQALQKDYEDKRQQYRREIAYGLSSILSQIQQQNPQMSFDLSMLGSLFLDNQFEKDGGSTTEMLRFQSSASTSKVKTF